MVRSWRSFSPAMRADSPAPSERYRSAIRLRSEIGELEDTLRGDKTPGQEKDGLLDTGRVLLDKLKEIGGPGA